MARLGNRAKHPAQKRYKAENRRYINKVRKAKKRYKNCPKLLQHTLSHIKQAPMKFQKRP